MWEKDYEVTEITNRNNVKIIKSMNDVEWADR
jgi:hypothetical protein